MPDQEVHEIQLNGKQLVFMFMAATVVSVVIFLCGVMVGRGVRQPSVDVLSTQVPSPVDPMVSIDPTAPLSRSGPGDTPVTPEETLTYVERLEATTPPPAALKPQSDSKPSVAPAVVDKEAPPPVVPAKAAETKSAAPPVVQKAAAKPEPTVPSAAYVEPRGRGYAVQVIAVPTLSEAETIAGRLKAKGYPSFVSRAGGAARAMYRVRVGKYDSKREAEAVSLRLQKQEHFAPWLTR